MSKNSDTSPLFFLFFQNIWILFKTVFFRTVQIKDSCIVDTENRRFYLLFVLGCVYRACSLIRGKKDLVFYYNSAHVSKYKITRSSRAEVTTKVTQHKANPKERRQQK